MPELSFPNPPLADEVVLLPPWTAEDVPAKVMGFADPSVQRFSWTKATPYTEEDARSFFTYQEDARRRGEELSFAFVEPGDPEVLGTELTTRRDAPRSATGWLRPPAGAGWRPMRRG
jgi:RimJ/RimL family protein N-acetyltransferase